MSGNRLPQSYDIDNNILPTNDSDKVEPAYTDTNVIRHYFHLPTKLGLCRFYSLYIQKSLGICTQHWQNYGNLIKPPVRLVMLIRLGHVGQVGQVICLICKLAFKLTSEAIEVLKNLSNI